MSLWPVPSSRLMGKEDVDMSTDEESDCVVVCAANDLEPVNHFNSEESDVAKGLRVLVEKGFGGKEYDADHSSAHSDENDHHDLELHHMRNLNLDSSMPVEKTMQCQSKKITNAKRTMSSTKSIMRSSANTSERSGCTVPQPFALATENRATGGSRLLENDVDAPNSRNKPASATNLHPNPGKKNQTDNVKHADEEDACSVTSSTTASVRAAKFKPTLGTAPTFRCTQRAEKRREFYSKLEEKHQALEAEKNQQEARNKEEKEAALKQLRKSMTFKATPMPSFYQEGPPPKVELKKPPPTRAKSPKFGRRKSCSDAVNRAQDTDKVQVTSGRLNRHSLGSQKELNSKLPSSSSAKKGTVCKVKVKEAPKVVIESPKSTAQAENGFTQTTEGNAGITVQ